MTRPMLVAALAAAALIGCGPPSVFFTTDVQATSTVKGNVLGGLLQVFPQAAGFNSFDLSQRAEFKNQGVRKQDVKSVKLQKLVIKITSPNDADFKWLESMRLSASAPGESKTLVASKSGVNSLGLKAPNPFFEMDVTGAELKPFVTAETMTISTDATGTQPVNDTAVEATATFGVDAFVFR